MRHVLLTTLFCAVACPVPGTTADAPPDYQALVRHFADTLLEHGRDHHGTRSTALWCGVINLADFSVPQHAKQIPLRKGARSQDRAIGGCNLHHDVSTLYAFRTLSALTGSPTYADAVNAYIRDYLAVAQHPKSGLIGWGEHMYYDIFSDAMHLDYGRSGVVHELVEWTTPWDLLWQVDPQATTRAIEGLKYHFYGEDPSMTGWLFNRHGTWSGSFSKPEKSQPWIKHAALYAYAYAFLYGKNQAADIRSRAQGIGALYWNHRHPVTNLTPVCLPGMEGKTGHPETDIVSFPLAAYFLLKAGQVSDADPAARERGLVMVKAFLAHSWDPQAASFRRKLSADGTPFIESDPKAILEATRPINPWTMGYGGLSSGLPRLGRIAAYCARHAPDTEFLTGALRVANVLKAAVIPGDVTPEALGFGIHLSLDLFDLTQDQTHLQQADHDARIAVERLFSNGLIRAEPGSTLYESKSGAGDLASALLRLSLRLNGQVEPAGIHDWSF